jgi:hypothetical protein
LKCGDTGYTISNERCSCGRADYGEITEDCVCIPEQYRNLIFDPSQVRSDCDEFYPRFLGKLHDEIIAGKLKCSNQFISSPINHSKSVFAYSCLQAMFRRGEQVFPYLDSKEVSAVMRDLEGFRSMGIIQDIKTELALLHTVEYVFIKLVPGEYYRDLITLIERRVRRGKSTIILSSYSWGYLEKTDQSNTLVHLQGDGSFNTVKVNNFWVKKG